MTLRQLIEYLEKEHQTQVVPVGFNCPHSYRGYYDHLAFEPKENITVAEMLACAKSALGETYEGYKGGSYTMHEFTNVYLAKWGNTGEEIGETLLNYMCGKFINKKGDL